MYLTKAINFIILLILLLIGRLGIADPFPPIWGSGIVNEASGPIHFSPAAWPSEPVLPKDCGISCGQWQPYTRFQGGINDPRVQDPSNGGTAPQNYVNISSSCIDKTLPSIYYYLAKPVPNDPTKDVIMFRWRVEQIANNYAIGPSAGNFGATDPWSSALWTVLFDINGDGYRDVAAHLNGSSGDPSHPVDLLAGIWGNIPTQSIDYLNDPSIKLIAHNPTAFTVGSSILNFNSNYPSSVPNTTWPSGSTSNSWDYGTSRSKLVYTNSCTEYFVDYQIPVRMLDASSTGPNSSLSGPKITRDTPLSMLFCTANSLNNPFQKDCALNRAYVGDASKPAPFGDYLSFNKTSAYSQPIISSVTATAPSSCSIPTYQLTAKVQDTLYVNSSGIVLPSIKSVKFYYWYDKNGDGTISGDTGSTWTYAVDGSLQAGTLNTWNASWDASSLLKGRYLIGVQAVDDKTLHDDGVPDAPVDNKTFSYIIGSTVAATQAEIYSNDWSWNGTAWIQGSNIGWLTGQQGIFPNHTPAPAPSANEDWYGNPDVTGTQIATAGIDLAINACGVAPSITKTASSDSVTVGNEITFNLIVSNPANNPNSVSLSQIQDNLPSGFSYKNNSTTGAFSTSNPSISSQNLTWSGNTSISPGSSVTLSFIAIAPSITGTFSNIGAATTDFGNIVSNPLAINVGAARLTINKTPNTYSSSPGSTVTYSITYSNDSSVNATGVVITDVLPTGLTYVTGSCSGGCVYTSGTKTLTWAIGSLSAGQASNTLTFQATLDNPYTGASTNQNTATITSNETAPTAATASIYVDTPRPQLTLNKTASTALVAPGSNVTFTLTYTNTGNASTNSVTLTDALPSGFTFVSATNPAGANCTTTPSICSASSGTVTWHLGTLAAGASGSVTVIAQASNPYTGTNNPSVNTASIASTEITTPVSDSASVGVNQSGQVCSSYYFRPTTGNVGFDGTKPIASQSPVPVAGDTGTVTTVTAPGKDGGTYTEAVRFYQNPASTADVTFSGTLTNNIYIDRSNGPALNFQAIVYDYNSTSGALTQLGIADPTTDSTMSFGGSTKGLLTFTIPLSGTLQKDHRLLWVYKVQSNHNTNTYPVEFQYNGTVTNGISGGTTNAISYANYCVTPPANLALEKSVNSASVNVTGTNRTLIYTLNYSNTSSSTNATGASIVDTLPTGVTFSSATLNSNPITPTGSNPYTFSLGAIAGGGTGTLEITANVANDLSGIASLVNTAQIQSNQTAAAPTGGATATTTVSGATSNPSGTPNVLVSKQASKTLLTPNDSVTYTLTAVNAGDKSATSVVVADDFPNQGYFTYGTCSTISGSCSESPAGSLAWNIGTLSPGQTVTLTFTMLSGATPPTGITLLDNAASVTYSGGGLGSSTSNTVTVSLSGNPNLVLTKNSSNPTPSPGDTLTYTLTLTNNGSADAVGVNVNDPIPANLSYYGSISAIDDDSANGSWSSNFDAVNNQVAFAIDKLSSGKTATLSFQAKVISSLTSGTTTVTNIGTASASNAAPRSASVASIATAAPIVSISKTGPSSVAFPAASLTAAATNATTLYVNSTTNLTIGQYIRIGSALAKITALTANSVNVDTQISASNGSAIVGSAKFDLSYKNTGNASATNVVITDTLPSGWLFIDATPTATSTPSVGQNGLVSWTLANLAAGASGTVQITAMPSVAGNSINTATITDSVYCLTSSTHSSCNASLATIVGGLQVSKSTSTATRSTVSPNNVASYTVTVSNTTGATITTVQVDDILPQGFTYKLGTTLINNSPASDPTYANSDSGHPIWFIDIPANSQITISFQADIAATVGAATYQNNVTLTKVGVGITPFDPLLTTAEDVTVLSSGTGLVQGVVYRDNNTNGVFNSSVDSALAGIAITILDKNGIAYVVYTDTAGYFSRVVPAGSTIIDVDNATLPAGLILTTGTDGHDPSTVIVPDGGVSNDNVGYVNASGPLGSITGRVWNDIDASQSQNGSETGLLAVQVLLRDNSGNIVATAYTDNLGNYSFPNLAVGNYSVDVVPISGYFVTTNNDPAPLSVTNGGNASANFGLKLGQTLSGSVFNDNGISGGTSADGLQNGGEVGTNAGGLNVVIADSSNHVLAVTSVNSDGSWSSGVPSGSNYRVFITTSNPVIGSVISPAALLPSGWGVTAENINSSVDTPHDGILTSVNATSNLSNINFGIHTIAADLSITKSHTGNFTQGQSSATYALIVSNNGNAPTSGTVTVTDTLPSGLVKTAISGTGWNCVLNTLTCTRSDALSNGHSYETITVTVDVSTNATASVTNNAQVSLPGETNTSNNTTSDITTITPLSSSSDMSVSNQSFPSSTAPLSTVTGSVTCTNLGPDAATNATCVVSGLPGGASVNCSLLSPQASLASGSSIVCSVSYTAPTSGSVTVLGSTGADNDSNSANNSASSPTTINPLSTSADVSVGLQNFPSTADPLSTVTGSVTCTNLGPDAATNASCSVTGLPVGALVNCSPNSPQASLANGSSIVCSVSYTAPASGSVTASGNAGANNDSNSANNNASSITTINTPGPSLTLTKTVYQGHNNGAGCPGLKELVVVDLNHPAKPVTWCFSVHNTGNTYLTTPILSDPLLNINQSALILKSGSLPLAPGATAIWYYEESRSQSLTNIASVNMTASNSSGTSLNLAPVQGADTVSTVFAYIFDPPFGLKTSSFNGVNIVRWTMVWINDSPIIATGVVITDPPPVGMTYVANTITCSPQGSTTVSSCSFEVPSVNYPRGRVLVTTNMGPDMGATNAATANNELLVSFDVTVPVSASSTTYLNQGQASWDPDPNDNVPPIQGVTNDPTNGQGGNNQPVATPIIVPPQNHSQSIPTLSEWAIFVISGFILLMGYYRLRRS